MGRGRGASSNCKVSDIIYSMTLITIAVTTIVTIVRHEDIVVGGDAGGRLRLATVPRGQQVKIILNHRKHSCVKILFVQGHLTNVKRIALYM